MAKKSSNNSNKVTFGRRKGRKPAKSVNKHSRKTSKYRGQGR